MASKNFRKALRRWAKAGKLREKGQKKLGHWVGRPGAPQVFVPEEAHWALCNGPGLTPDVRTCPYKAKVEALNGVFEPRCATCFKEHVALVRSKGA